MAAKREIRAAGQRRTLELGRPCCLCFAQAVRVKPARRPAARSVDAHSDAHSTMAATAALPCCSSRALASSASLAARPLQQQRRPAQRRSSLAPVQAGMGIGFHEQQQVRGPSPPARPGPAAAPATALPGRRHRQPAIGRAWLRAARASSGRRSATPRPPPPPARSLTHAPSPSLAERPGAAAAAGAHPAVAARLWAVGEADAGAGPDERPGGVCGAAARGQGGEPPPLLPSLGARPGPVGCRCLCACCGLCVHMMRRCRRCGMRRDAHKQLARCRRPLARPCPTLPSLLPHAA